MELAPTRRQGRFGARFLRRFVWLTLACFVWVSGTIQAVDAGSALQRQTAERHSADSPGESLDVSAAALRADFSQSGVRLTLNSDSEAPWELGLALTGLGLPGEPGALDPPVWSRDGERFDAAFPASFVTGTFFASRRGLEQSYTLALPSDRRVLERPWGLALDLEMTGNLGIRNAELYRSVDLVAHDGRAVLRYALISATGTGEKEIQARLEPLDSGHGVRILLDAPDAAYFPIRVRLLTTTPEVMDSLQPDGTLADEEPEPAARELFAPPSNDQCAGAEVIPGAGPFPHLTAVTADITDATTTGDPRRPSCQGTNSRSIWYTFAPAVSGFYTISSCADAPTGTTVDNTVMAIYTADAACVAPFAQISNGCDDNSCVDETNQAVITHVSLDAGTTYYIVMWKQGTAAPTAGNTAVQLRVSRDVAPNNDTCSGVVALALNAPLAGTNQFAANDYQITAGGCFAGMGNIVSSAVGRDSVYSFTAPSAGTYSFRAQPTENGGDVVLYTASTCPSAPPTQTVGTCLLAANRRTDAATWTGSEELYCQSLGAGQTVYAFVDEATFTTSGGGYTIEVNRCFPESEPNDSPGQAGSLVCGLEGSVSPAGDPDFFGLGAPSSGSRLFAMADGVAAPSTDFDLRVTTAADTLEYDDQNNDAPFGGTSPNCAGTPLTGVASYLRVSQFVAAAQAEPYRLYAVVQPPIGSAATEIEPDDTPAQANLSPGNYYRGTLTSSADLDFYRFSATAGDLIYIGADGDPLRNETPLNLTLSLYDLGGNALLAVNDLDSSASSTPGTGSLTSLTPNSPAEGILWRARYSGTYFARVSSFNGGDYLLSIALNCLAGGVTSQSDLSVTKTAAPNPVGAGQDLTYTITVTNNGPDAALGAQMVDATPAGTTFRSVTTPAGWTCTTPAVGGTGAVSCAKGSMAASTSEVLTLVVRVNQCFGNGTVSNTATVSSSGTDPVPGNNSAIAGAVVTDPGTCDDGLFCTVGDACVAGSCVGAARPCGDTNPCTADSCDEGTDACVNNPVPLNGSSCNDGLFCTIGEICNAGTCGGGSPNCNDSNPCTADSCDEGTDSCLNNPVPLNGSACSDGLFCTIGETCNAGTCGGGTPNSCSDSNPCTADSCNESTDSCLNDPVPLNGSACSDGLFCTIGETCNAGACGGGSPNCNDSNPCTSDSCDEGNDACANDPVPLNGSNCSDGLFCTIGETCNAGTCGGGSPNCNDSNPCTSDSCDEGNDACANDPVPLNGSNCSDGLFCTIGETCNAGTCGGGSPNACSDSNPCTADSCDEGTDACINNPVPLNGSPCSDGLFCTLGETCNAGTCGGGSPNCNDSNPCTADSCDEGNDACANDPVPLNGSPCSDGLFCTLGETCNAGACGGGSPNCNDSNPCTADSCDEGNDACANDPVPLNGSNCSDGLFCTIGETCNAGTCGGGSPNCNDSNPCTADSCDEGNDACANDPVPLNGSNCSDGLFCTIGETCNAGTCGGGSPNCNDSNPCTADSCDEGNDACANNPVPLNGSACDDGNACTYNDTCAAGTCGGVPIVTPDEVTNVRFDDKVTILWDTAAGAGPGTVHDVPRGLVSQLPVGAGGSETCLASGIAAATTSDPSDPAVGDSYWYLVRGKNSCGGAGPYGFAAVGGTPTTPRTTATCP